MVDVVVENIVASSQIADEIDLDRLSREISDVEYHPEVFPGLTVRCVNSKTVVIVFSSGKVVCTGAKSAADAKAAIQKVCNTFKDKGFSVYKNPRVTVQNMVASASLKKELDLGLVASFLGANVEYEPKQFLGIVYRGDSDVVVLLFSSGRIICTGGKSEKEVNETIEKLVEELLSIGVVGK
ncbi:MAG TPA: TATA-box-binding protein [Thermoplasmata archaeon]|nr:TATA-box-binding protein [Thermoplasmata archaeon]